MSNSVCNGCGACCDPVMVPYTKLEAATNYNLDASDRRWILEDLTPMSRREAKAKAPWLFGDRQQDQLVDARTKALVMPLFYSCRNYDPETGRCAIYEDRPSVCRDYPWYEGVPDPTLSIPPMCAFNADVGRMPVPIELTVKA